MNEKHLYIGRMDITISSSLNINLNIFLFSKDGFSLGFSSFSSSQDFSSSSGAIGPSVVFPRSPLSTLPYRGLKEQADALVPIIVVLYMSGAVPPTVVIIVSARVFQIRRRDTVSFGRPRRRDGRFPKEMISVKKCRPRVGDSVPDRDMSSFLLLLDENFVFDGEMCS